MKNNRVASFSLKAGKAAKDGFLGAESFYIFDGLTDGVCIINERGYIEYFNGAYERILKISSHTETGMNIFLTKNDDVLLTAFREKRCICGYLSLHNGAAHVSASASPIYSDGEFKGVIAIYREEAAQDMCRKKDTVIEFNSPPVNYMSNIRDMFKDIVGESSAIMKALQIAYKAAQTSSNVLIRGESGTGKGLIARAIHNNSSRAKGPYSIVNCGAIPSTLLESELFGYERGAFTGAVRRKIGKFEQADGGTLFLDEIGDMPPDMQVKILRVIQDKELERIGGCDTIRCDVRIIAATHCNLEALVEKGTFREDLYYRLNVLPIYVPSLKERREDIPMLLEHFIKRISINMNKEIAGVSPEAENCLLNYDWPGNIRELENLVERVIALTDGNEIDMNSLPSKISSLYRVNQHTYSAPALINMNNSGNIATLEEYEKEIIKEALARFGSYNAAGKALGITHKTVALKARRYNIVI
ncbi:MAG: sigma 54-interacting transcriptional regulator [Clostridia bacterium]|nr:sigma 54-interacting transcriptional regulator [Clostridia bacterium]HOM42065.1 sigma 54-interacting transcriptional regulator [Bacillota bacterium]